MFSSGDDNVNFNQGGYNSQAPPATSPSQFSGAPAMHHTGYQTPLRIVVSHMHNSKTLIETPNHRMYLSVYVEF